MYIIAGLGNPGQRYAKTRHNVGFVTVDILAGMLGINIDKAFGKALIGTGNIENEKVVLVKPQTFMNLSGESILDIKNWYKIDLSNIIVIYDDVDLKVGCLRVRRSGSAGTHNGMRSVIYNLNSEEFPRVRIGIGAAPLQMELADYVLSAFGAQELPSIADACEKASKAVKLIITKGVEEAMRQCNG